MWQTVYTLIRPTFCRVWSGSTLFSKACLSQYLRLLQYFSTSRSLHTVNRHNYFPPCDVVIQINALLHFLKKIEIIFITFINNCTLMVYEGQSENIQTFALSHKPLIYYYFFQTFFLFFFKVFPTYVYTSLHLPRIFCIPSANHEEDLLLRYWFTAEIKAALVSYLFPVSLFQFWKQKLQGARSGLYRGLDNNCHLKDVISSIVYEAIWEEALSCI